MTEMQLFYKIQSKLIMTVVCIGMNTPNHLGIIP